MILLKQQQTLKKKRYHFKSEYGKVKPELHKGIENVPLCRSYNTMLEVRHYFFQ